MSVWYPPTYTSPQLEAILLWIGVGVIIYQLIKIGIINYGKEEE